MGSIGDHVTKCATEGFSLTLDLINNFWVSEVSQMIKINIL